MRIAEIARSMEFVVGAVDKSGTSRFVRSVVHSYPVLTGKLSAYVAFGGKRLHTLASSNFHELLVIGQNFDLQS